MGRTVFMLAGSVAVAGLLCAAASSRARALESAAGLVRASAPVDTDELIALIRRGLSTGEPSAREQLVRGIRSLRDPAFGPLLAHLADSTSGSVTTPGVRTQAILALAECDPGTIDLLLVRKLTPAEQAAVLAEALQAGLLRKEQTDELARWPDLQPGVLYSLQARLAAAGRPIDEPRLLSMADGQPGALGGAALLILAQGAAEMDDRESALARLIKMIGPAKAAGGGAEPSVLDGASLRALVTMSGQWGLTRTGAFATEALGAFPGDSEARLDAVAALMQIEPGSARTLAAWLDAHREAVERKEQSGVLRLSGMAQRALLRVPTQDPASPALRNVLVMAERLSAQRDELARRSGAALRALASGSDDLSQAVEGLVLTRHPPSMTWCMDAAAGGRIAEPAWVYRLVIETLRSEGAPWAEQVAMDAAGRLFAKWPEEAGSVLRRAFDGDDRPTARRVLTGALQSGERSKASAGVLLAVLAKGERGGVREGALGALLSARGACPEKPGNAEGWLTGEEEDRLARIAQGEGELAEPLRMQAAWLVIRHRQKERLALAQIIADVMP